MSKRWRVLCLVSDAYGGRGGIAQACRDMIDALAFGDEVERIDILPRHAPDPPRDVPCKVRQRLPRLGRVAYAVSAIGAAGGRPDIIFCNHLFMGPLAAIIARSVGAKLVIQLHGIEIWHPPSAWQRRALEAADLVWCVSRDTRARALTYADIPPERAIVVNNTFKREFSPGDRASARVRFDLSNETVLLSVGRLDARERYKGNDRVIYALADLRREGTDAIYLIAGEGNDRPRLECLARESNVLPYVRFLGNIGADDLPDLYRAADLFALPSTGEGFGIAYLEAMACGTPAMGLSVGGATDALANGELGVCVSEADFPEALIRTVATREADPMQLAAAVLARFGPVAFQNRVAQTMALLA